MAKTKRKVDVLGRVVLPAQFRSALNLSTGSRVDVDMEGGKITITAGNECCAVCCGELDDVRTISIAAGQQNRVICCHCATKIAQEVSR